MLQESDFAFYSMNQEAIRGGGQAFSLGTRSASRCHTGNPDQSSQQVSNPCHRPAMARDDSCIDPGPRNTDLAEVNQRPQHRRYNTTSTIFVTDHMSAPDRDGTITCVCAVIRAHLQEAHARLCEGGTDLDSTSVISQKFEENSYILPNPPRTIPTLKMLS